MSGAVQLHKLNFSFSGCHQEKTISQQEEIKQKVMEQVKGAIPIPSLSGPALPTGPLTPQQDKAEKGKALGVPFNPF